MWRRLGQGGLRCARWLGVFGTLTACNSYDSRLLAPRASHDPLTGGAGGVSGVGGATGTGGKEEGTGGTIGTDDGGVMPGDVTLSTRCGDGQVTGVEKCDISIEPGKPGACPTECPDLGICTHRELNGMGSCQAECVVLQASCKGGDGCCPAGCNHGMDSDCSASCHDGVVQSDKGETCEPDSTTSPCKTAADCDDKNPCTVDTFTGSPENCNADCGVPEPITALKDGDGCCPENADNNTDKDCAIRCGNGVREMGEVCDGGIGCSADCKSSSLSPDQQRCLQDFALDDCEKCSCMNCVMQYMACRDADKTAGNDKCRAVTVCSRKNNCVGTPCYCGDAPINCSLGNPLGPCKAEIETAAGAAAGDWVTVNNETNRAGSPLNLAYVTDMCRISNCSKECR